MDNNIFELHGSAPFGSGILLWKNHTLLLSVNSFKQKNPVLQCFLTLKKMCINIVVNLFDENNGYIDNPPSYPCPNQLQTFRSIGQTDQGVGGVVSMLSI